MKPSDLQQGSCWCAAAVAVLEAKPKTPLEAQLRSVQSDCLSQRV